MSLAVELLELCIVAESAGSVELYVCTAHTLYLSDYLLGQWWHII